jgi:hypothetical protein
MRTREKRSHFDLYLEVRKGLKAKMHETKNHAKFETQKEP